MDELTNEGGVSWWDYARSYDLLCEVNYHYADLLHHFKRWLGDEASNRPQSVPMRICELGAGTGNFLLETIEAAPGSSLTHWDWNSEMTSRAKSKYQAAGIEPIVVQKDISDFCHHQDQFQIITMINALYAFPRPAEVLRAVHEKLSDGGKLYVVDVGREISPLSWTRDLYFHTVRERGVIEGTRILFKLRKAIHENRKIDEAANQGDYWRHTTQDFQKAIEKAGFVIETAETCYRGIADRVVAIKT